MQDFTIPEHVTIESHRVSAGYQVDGTIAETPVSINGYTLNEIITDLVDFFNSMEEHADDFNVWKVTGDTEHLEIIIKGSLLRFDVDHGYKGESAPVTVSILATEK